MSLQVESSSRKSELRLLEEVANHEKKSISVDHGSSLESLEQSSISSSSVEGYGSKIGNFFSTIGSNIVWPFVKIYEAVASIFKTLFCCYSKSGPNIVDRFIQDPVAIFKEAETNSTQVAEDFVDLIVNDPKKAEASLKNLINNWDKTRAACDEYTKEIAKTYPSYSEDQIFKVLLINFLVNLILAETPQAKDKELVDFTKLFLTVNKTEREEKYEQLSKQKGSKRADEIVTTYYKVKAVLSLIDPNKEIVNLVYSGCLNRICGESKKEIFVGDLLEGFQKDGFAHFASDAQNFNALKTNLDGFIAKVESSKEKSQIDIELLKFIQTHFKELMKDPLKFAKTSNGDRFMDIAVEVFKEIITKYKNNEHFASSPFIQKMFGKVESAFKDSSKAKEIVFFFLNVGRAIDEAADEEDAVE